MKKFLFAFLLTFLATTVFAGDITRDKITARDHVVLEDITAPSNAPTGAQRLYVDTTDSLVRIKDASGAVLYLGTSKQNLSATTDPTANEDSGDGYAPGSLWVNVTADKVFINVDATVAAAIWKDLSTPGGSVAWTDLTDTPGSISSLQFVRGNSGGTALEFTTDIVQESDFANNSLRFKNNAGVMGNITVSASQLVGRESSGEVKNLTKTQSLGILNVEDGAEVTSTSKVDLAGAVMESDMTNNTIRFKNSAGSTANIAPADNTIVCRDQTTGDAEIQGCTAVETRALLNIADGADITDAATVNAAGAVMETDFASNSLRFKNNAGVMGNITVSPSQVVGRAVAGEVRNLTKAETLALLNVEDGAQVTDATAVDTAGAVMESDLVNNSIRFKNSLGATANVVVLPSEIVGRKATGEIDDLTAAETRTILNVADGADITDTATVDAAGAVMESDLVNNSLRFKNSVGATGNIVVGPSNLVGRASAGEVKNLTATEGRIILNVEDNADVTDATNVDSAGAVMESDYAGNSIQIKNNALAMENVVIADDNILCKDASTGEVDIQGCTKAETLTLLNVEDGADVTDASSVNAAGAVMESDFGNSTIRFKTSLGSMNNLTLGLNEIPVRAGSEIVNLPLAVNTFLGRAGGNIEELNKTEALANLNVADGADVTDSSSVDAAGAVMDSDISVAEGFLRKTGAGLYEALKSNIGASTDPGASNDNTQGYVIGSIWINVSLDKVFQAVDVSTGAAVWRDLSGAAVGGSQWQDTGLWLVPNTSGDGMEVRDGTDADHFRISHDGTNGILNLNAGQFSFQDNIIFPSTQTVDGRDLSVDGTKLDGIESAADVTDTVNVAAANAIMDSDISPVEGFMRKTGVGLYTAIKSNLGSTVNPTVNEDSGDGYGIGSVWINVTADSIFQAVDVTVAAAVWLDLSVAGSGTVDTSGTPVAGDYAKFTDADTIEGKSFTEVRTDLNIEDGSTADQTDAEIKTAYENNSNTNEYSDAEQTTVLSVENNADVTDTINVTSAGALMDSEVDVDLKTFVLPASTTISTFGRTLVDDAAAVNARATLEVQPTSNPAFTGTLSVSGTTALTAGALTINPTGNAAIEFGNTSSATTPFIDFHSSATSADYHARIIASGGTTVGTGTLTITADTLALGNTDLTITGGSIDGRDVADDGTKLDGIETSATADQTNAEIKTAYEANANSNEFDDAEQSKLAAIETLADVTDTINVTSAGALMDSEVDVDLKTLVLPATMTITTFGASLVDDAAASNARTTLSVQPTAGPFFTGTLTASAGITLTTGVLTLGANGIEGGQLNMNPGSSENFTKTIDSQANQIRFISNSLVNFVIADSGLSTTRNGFNVTAGNITLAPSATVDGRDLSVDGTKLDGIENNANVTDEANVVSSLDGAIIGNVTVASGDKVLIQDITDADNLKTVTAQSIADLGGGGGGVARNFLWNPSCETARKGTQNNMPDQRWFAPRWRYDDSGVGALSFLWELGSVTGKDDFHHVCRLSVGTTDTSIAAADYYQIVKVVPAFDAARFAFGTASAKTLTLSFDIYSGLTGTMSVAFLNEAKNRSYVTTFTVDVINTWETKEITIVGDTTGTWERDNGRGLSIYWTYACGTNQDTATLNSWTATLDTCASTNTNFMNTAIITRLAAFKLEIGSAKTDFVQRSWDEEKRSAENWQKPITHLHCHATSTTALACVVPNLSHVQFGNPKFDTYDCGGGNITAVSYLDNTTDVEPCSSAAAGNSSEDGMTITVIGFPASSFTDGQAYFMRNTIPLFLEMDYIR